MVLAQIRSRILRCRKHNSLSFKSCTIGISVLTLLLLALTNVFLLKYLKIPLPKRPSPTLVSMNRIEHAAGGNPDYHRTPLQADVRNVTRTMYRAYMDSCMGRDEFEPTTNQCLDWFNIGLTVLDSLDTLILMDLEPEYQQSRQWAADRLSFRKIDEKVSIFEIVIRAIGGLNSAYQLTNDTLWLNKSVELGEMLLQSFELDDLTCPPPTVFIGDNIKSRTDQKEMDVISTPAEVGTLQLEFRTLSQLSGNPKFAKAVDKCQNVLVAAVPSSGLVPSHYDVSRNAFYGSRICVGGGVDSFYEMLVKNWITWGKEDDALRDAYETAIAGIYKNLARKRHGHVFIGEIPSVVRGHVRDTMDHLACFLPGTLAIAAQHGLGGGLHGEGKHDYMPRARALTESCFAMTRGTRSGLAGEITDFHSEVPKPKVGQDVSLLRPEIVEALYYMDKLDPKAGDKYKEMGRIMWKDMRRSAQVATKPDGVMSSTFNLLFSGGAQSHSDKLHSFVIAETYKYFYLLFDERPPFEGPFPLDRWVYNTEAHPIRIADHRL